MSNNFIRRLPNLCIASLSISHLVLSASLGTTVSSHTRRAGKGKAGLGWPNGAANDISQYYSSKLSWYYSWSPWAVVGADLGFVPMFWGVKQASDFQSQITTTTITNNSWTSILGMNEPEQASESYVNVGDGAAQWKQYIEPLKTSNPSIRLGSPACTNAPIGKQWMYDFFGACGDGCTVDFVALHYYGLANSTDFIAHVTDYHDSFQRPIWVTEWACQNYGDPSLGQCTDDQIETFLKDMQSWMDSTDFVERYAWFGAMENMQGVNQGNALMDPQGKITSLGKQYIGSGGKGSTSSSSSAYPTGTTTVSDNGGGGVSISGVQADFKLDLQQILWRWSIIAILLSLLTMA
ncbi:hypothetical protein FRB94_014118 [Tulasnella sp. JGI-2019a]|nr:hypothetical protein FRB94_014118 [Tulasnella sp. JGI-2019a]